MHLHQMNLFMVTIILSSLKYDSQRLCPTCFSPFQAADVNQDQNQDQNQEQQTCTQPGQHEHPERIWFRRWPGAHACGMEKPTAGNIDCN